MSTFWKRAKYYASLSNPRGFFTSDEKIEQYQDVLERVEALDDKIEDGEKLKIS